MTVNSRSKGCRGEREWRDVLNAAGFLGAKRGQQHSGGTDSPDVICESMPEFHPEVKRTETLSLYVAMEQAINDAGTKIPYVAHRRNGKDWLVCMLGQDWLNLVRDAQKWRAYGPSQPTMSDKGLGTPD